VNIDFLEKIKSQTLKADQTPRENILSVSGIWAFWKSADLCTPVIYA
jgi:hypothetical protein